MSTHQQELKTRKCITYRHRIVKKENQAVKRSVEKEAILKRDSEKKSCEKMWVCEKGFLLYQKRAFSFYLNGYTQLLLYNVGLVPDYLHDKGMNTYGDIEIKIWRIPIYPEILLINLSIIKLLLYDLLNITFSYYL